MKIQEIPCSTCLVLGICKAKVNSLCKEEIEKKREHYLGGVLSQMISDCSILKSYATNEEYYNNYGVRLPLLKFENFDKILKFYLGIKISWKDNDD